MRSFISEGHRAPGAFLIACVLLVAFLAQSFLASRIKSPTFDETTHIAAGLKQLKDWLDHHARGRNIRLAYFGTILPEAYGVACERIGPEELMEDPQPGLYVVSAHFVARVPALGARLKPGAGEWLRRTPPVAIVGHSLYVYDIGTKARTRL
jgi:hypothetical protein